MTAFPNFRTVALPSAFSDHTPILLTFNKQTKQQKGLPFRYVNNWCFFPGYLQCILQGYESNTWGSVAYQFIYKLKIVKENLKAWNRLRDKNNQINKLQEDFSSAFLQLDQDPDNTLLYDMVHQISATLTEKLQRQHLLLQQQSKVLWLQQGDSSTKFFYAKMSMRRQRNTIQALLKPDGSYIYDHEQIKNEAISYYQSLFNGHVTHNFPAISVRKKINIEGKRYLALAVTMDEIKEALYSIDDAKSPGPDGFSSKFYNCTGTSCQVPGSSSYI